MPQDDELDLDPVTLDILDLLRRQAGDAFSAEELADQLDYTPAEVETGLARLGELGFVEKTERAGAPAFIISSGAPEL